MHPAPRRSCAVCRVWDWSRPPALGRTGMQPTRRLRWRHLGASVRGRRVRPGGGGRTRPQRHQPRHDVPFGPDFEQLCSLTTDSLPTNLGSMNFVRSVQRGLADVTTLAPTAHGQMLVSAGGVSAFAQASLHHRLRRVTVRGSWPSESYAAVASTNAVPARANLDEAASCCSPAAPSGVASRSSADSGDWSSIGTSTPQSRLEGRISL